MSADDSPRRLKEKVQQLQALLDFGRAVTGLASPDDIVRRLALTVAGQWALRTWGVAVRREGQEPLVRHRGLSPFFDPGGLPLAGRGSVFAEAGTRPRRLAAEPVPEGTAPGTLARIAAAGVKAVVPLVDGETPCGVIALGARPGDAPWGDEELEYASGLATQALVALEASWQREEARQWRLLGQAREEWRRLDLHSSLVFAAVARLGPRDLPEEASLVGTLAGLLEEAGLELGRPELQAALRRLVSEGAIERVAGDRLELRKLDWLLLPEVRGPLAELVRQSLRRVGGWELLQKIGEGGMAEVYRARSLVDGSEAALKLISEERSDDAAMRGRFEREGEIVSRLSHPNVVRLLDRGEHEGRLYLVMELLPGETVHRACRRRPFSVDESLRALRQIGSALKVLHGSGVLHRDVKAGNIMRRPEGDFVLLDFGLARGLDARSVTRSGEIVGTAAYLAPEVLSGGAASPASDVWALGIVFLEMLTGRWPWKTDGGMPLAVAILRTRPQIRAELAQVADGAVKRVVDGMLAEDPFERIADGAALVAALSRLPESVAGALPPLPRDEAEEDGTEDGPTKTVEVVIRRPGPGRSDR